MEENSNSIMMFQDTFDYLISGDWTEHQFCELMRLIYKTRFCYMDCPVNEVEDKDVRGCWRSLRPTVLKSSRNSKHYLKEKEKSSSMEADKDLEVPTTPAAPQKPVRGAKKSLKTNTPSVSSLTTSDVGRIEEYLKANNYEVWNKYPASKDEDGNYDFTNMEDAVAAHFGWTSDIDRTALGIYMDLAAGRVMEGLQKWMV